MKLLSIIAIVFPMLAWTQVGGKAGYQSLNLTTNPRAAALGGTVISLADRDLSQFFENPATLDSMENGNIFFHFNPYFADVSVYAGAYTFNVGNMGTFATGINYVNYGSFDLTDETGAKLGTFQSQDYTLTAGKAHQLGPITLGVNLKLAHTSIETYSSTAILMDMGGVFRISRYWVMAMVFENMGVRLSEFSALSSPSIPFDVKLGTSFKPEYMPVRFTLTSNNLVSQNTLVNNNDPGGSSRGIDKVWKRVNLGAELLLSKNFQLLVGYNHKRKQELKLNEVSAGAGWSFGAMVRIKRLELRFSRATYHAAGGSSFISLRTDLNDFKKIL